ncbi:MAG TPA: DJ-1/PfpI family protein [Burkholderiales bacterium]|nr:DJ-1/PfpI family protein [Burkholderiales bacterium]
MKAAMIVFERMTYLDFVGFYDPVTRLKSMNIIPDFEWRICSNRPRVADDRGPAGMTMVPESIMEPLNKYDLLFVPGGLGTRTLQSDSEFVEWLKTADSAKLKVSVCTGSLLLGAAGFLRGKRATTHPGALKELEPYCDTVLTDRIVDEGNVITGSGVATSIDLGLHVVQQLAGPDARSRIAAQMCYPYQWKT